MKLRETSLDEFVSAVTEQSQRIVIYGAGVIGTVTLPMIIEERQLTNNVLFIVDADRNKLNNFIRIGDRNIEICSPQCMRDIKEKFVVLITGSRFMTILQYLEQLEELSEIDVFILPQMLIRQCRFFEKQEIRKKSESPMIPRTIHYCWFGKNELPDELKRCKESWYRFCPDYQIVEWNENNYDVERHEYTRQAYKHKKWGFVSDVARLEILYKNGGIYLDTDVELIQGLDILLFQPGFVGVEKWGVVNTGGGCGVVPHHSIIREMLEYRLTFSFERADGSLNLESSGSFESKTLLRHGFRPDNTIQTVSEMTVYSSDFFHPYDYMSQELCITENTYGIHHFAGSWV